MFIQGHQGRGFVNSHGVAFDGDGYAVPEAGPSHAKHNVSPETCTICV